MKKENRYAIHRMILCPLCLSKDNNIEDVIHVDQLEALYRSFLGESIEELFEGYETISKMRCLNCGLFFFNPRVVGNDIFYSLLHKKLNYYPSEKDEYTYALRLISEEDRVLEVGCGTGEFGKHVNNYSGLDINEDALEIAKKKGLHALDQTIKEHSRENFETYDVVCAFQVLEHMPEPREFVANCIICLKQGGRLIFSVPSADSFIIFVQNHLLNFPPHHQTWWSDKTFKHIEKMFPLKLLDIYHEKVQNIHLESYVKTLYREILGKFFPCSKESVGVNVRIWDRIVNKLSSYLYKKTLDIFEGVHFRPNGHTVTVLYQKAGHSILEKESKDCIK